MLDVIMHKRYSLTSHATHLVSFYVTCTALILHLILPLCHAKVFQIPLKQYRTVVSSSSLVSAAYHNSDDVHVYKRQASLDKIDFQSMKGNLNGLSGDGYYVDINVGSPPQKLQVLIDTGSANFAFACGPDENLNIFFQRQNSSSYEEDGTEIYVPYTEGEWTGKLGTDVVSLTSTSELSVEAKFACITSSHNFYEQGTDWEGILGLAYSELARPDSSITPFWDSLTAAHPELENIFSIQLCGSSFVHTREEPLMKGSLILGGILPSMADSEIFYAPLYKEWYYEVIITDIHVGGKSLQVACKEYNMDKTIVDTGTTTIRLPIKIFKAVTDSIIEAFEQWDSIVPPSPLFYSGVEGICFDDMALPFQVFPVVSFFLMESENTSFQLDLTPQHYLRPYTTASDGGQITQSCVKFGFSSSATGTVLGAVLMEAFYVVFDRANSRLGFAQTSCPLPDPTNKILNTTLHGPFTSNTNLNTCAFQKPDSGEGTLRVTTYVLLALSLIVCIPLILFCIFRLRNVYQRRWNRHLDDEFSETQTVFSAATGTSD